MRLSPLPLLVPAALIAAFGFGFHGLLTAGYDRAFWWALTIGSAAGSALAVALHVWSVDERLQELEQKVSTMSDRGHGPAADG